MHTMSPSAIAQAEDFVRVFNAKMDKKFGGSVNSSSRAAYWRLILAGIQKAENAIDPFVKLIVSVNVGW